MIFLEKSALVERNLEEILRSRSIECEIARLVPVEHTVDRVEYFVDKVDIWPVLLNMLQIFSVEKQLLGILKNNASHLVGSVYGFSSKVTPVIVAANHTANRRKQLNIVDYELLQHEHDNLLVGVHGFLLATLADNLDSIHLVKPQLLISLSVF